MKKAIGVTANTSVICTESNKPAMIVGVREDVNSYVDGELKPKQARFVDMSDSTCQIVNLIFSNKYELSCGLDTEFLLKDGTFVRCSDIPIGAELYTTTGTKVILKEFSFYHGNGESLCRVELGGYYGVELANHIIVRIGE